MNKDKRKAYDRARYLSQKERIATNNRRWREANKQRVKELTTAWRKKHPKRWVALVRKWQRLNSDAMYLANVRRKRAKGSATPAWADREAIRRIYAEARANGLEVDHCVPLKSPVVCGLHWEGNLRLVTKSENCRKGNRSWESQP